MVRNWFHLGQQFKLSNETLKEIEYGPFSPTEVVMKSLYSRKTDLTIGTFYDVVKELKRHDVLKKLDPFIVGELKTWTIYTCLFLRLNELQITLKESSVLSRLILS